MLLKLYVPWKVVTNFLPVILAANKQDHAGARLLAWTIEILLKSIYPKNKILCEPQMGKRGLYPTLSKKNKNSLNFAAISDYHPLRQAPLLADDVAGISTHYEFMNPGAKIDQLSLIEDSLEHIELANNFISKKLSILNFKF